MKFFFDNNLSMHLAHGIRELSATMPGVEKVEHLTDLFPANAFDIDWIGVLADDGPRYIISIDRFKKQRGAEREAMRRAGHTVFTLDSQWSTHPFWTQTERFVQWWPQIVNYARIAAGGTYRVPWRHSRSSMFVALPF